MAIVSPEEYYNDSAMHGNYQYVSLEEVIAQMELERLDEDSYLEHTKRYKMVHHAKQGLRELTAQAAKDILAFEVTVGTSLVVTLPQDYVNYVRVSVVTLDPQTGSFRLHPLDTNHNINIADGYLQDNDYFLLFDHNGEILRADDTSGYAFPYTKYAFDECGGQSNLDTAKLSRYGEFTVDERRGKLLLSSELADRQIVVEYVSDGLQANLSESEITIHKHIVPALKDWIYYACIAYKRNVPANEKKRALDRYKTSMHEAKLKRADFDLLQIARALRSTSMNL
jgi:hypothetical protein